MNLIPAKYCYQLASGRIAYKLSEAEAELALDIADERSGRPRRSKRGESVSGEDYVNHHLGAIGEIVVANYYSGELDGASWGGDSGVDIWVAGRGIQVKASNHFAEGTRLLYGEFSYDAAPYWFQVAVDRQSAYAEIIGWARLELLRAQEWERVYIPRSGKYKDYRTLREDQLTRPNYVGDV